METKKKPFFSVTLKVIYIYKGNIVRSLHLSLLPLKFPSSWPLPFAFPDFVWNR